MQEGCTTACTEPKALCHNDEYASCFYVSYVYVMCVCVCVCARARARSLAREREFIIGED